MYSKARIFGHPIHPMIVGLPITFYITTLIGFGVYQFISHEIFWFRLAFFCNMAGVISAVVAAVPGFIDWFFGIPKNTKARSRGLLHMGLNVGALVFFCITAIQILGTWDSPLDSVIEQFILSVIGVSLTAVAGFHGWELIARHKVGVDLTPEQERLEPVEKTEPRKRPASHPNAA